MIMSVTRSDAYKRRIEAIARKLEAEYIANPKEFDRYGVPSVVVDFETREVWLNSFSAAEHLVLHTPLGEIPMDRFEDYMTPSGVTSAQRAVLVRLAGSHPRFVQVMARRMGATPVLVKI